MHPADFLFPFWRATWEHFVMRPYHRIRGWWWKRQHPLEYLILEAAIAHRMQQTKGKLFPDLVTDSERRMVALIYGEMGLRTRNPDKRWLITDA